MKYITLFETDAAYNAATLDLPNVSLVEETMSVSYNPYVEPETRVVAKFNVTDTSNPAQLYGLDAINQFSVIEIDGVEQPNVVSEYTFSTTGEHTVKYTLADPTSIGWQAFNNCSGITSIDIPDSVTSISGSAFEGCSNLININIPDSVTSIGNQAFSGCGGLTSITIPNGVTGIGNSVFSYCTGLTSVTIPNGVTYIGSGAFSICTGLTSIVIPDSVTSIGEQALNGCRSLTSITSNAMTAPTIGNYTFYGVKTDGTLTVPSGSTGYDAWMSTEDHYLGKYNWTKVEQ